MKSNDDLQKDVLEEIRWDPQLRNVVSQIGVTAGSGVITLSGMVDSYSRKVAAERAAQRVLGVKVVASDLEVRLEAGELRTDTQIAETIANVLSWHTALSQDKIEIKVENGRVLLEGSVDWEYQKKAAESAVQDILGVRGVTNQIAVTSAPNKIDAQKIKERIATAFQRSALVDSSSIRVEILGSRVTLHGRVRTWIEKEDAENVAWSSPGVLLVDNQIEIDTEVLV